MTTVLDSFLSSFVSVLFFLRDSFSHQEDHRNVSICANGKDLLTVKIIIIIIIIDFSRKFCKS